MATAPLASATAPQATPPLVLAGKRLPDLFIIGGGINGCGIARDAAGRGLSVGLAEMNDLASATSSASTKLFHGGLRYLEYFEIRLVREALIEREGADTIAAFIGEPALGTGGLVPPPSGYWAAIQEVLARWFS